MIDHQYILVTAPGKNNEMNNYVFKSKLSFKAAAGEQRIEFVRKGVINHASKQLFTYISRNCRQKQEVNYTKQRYD